ncbi:homoprotocatechuate degradation operon regulator HpaR [Piscinibacter sp.]|uniref:homoprotocatechuate degradation operon regulator HpaR n=1 Tax=Piscinibacter sp. TaxID=1903157 RepID=UPI0039E29DD2
MSTRSGKTPRAKKAAEPASFRHRNLPLLLLQAREGVLAHFRPILNSHGVTEQQWRVVRALYELGERGELEPRQIGELCRISSPSLAGVLARMDELGLVARERMAGDQRRVRVTLTARSRAMAAAMAPRIESMYREIEAQIGVELIQRCYATVDELMARLGELPGSGEAED